MCEAESALRTECGAAAQARQASEAQAAAMEEQAAQVQRSLEGAEEEASQLRAARLRAGDVLKARETELEEVGPTTFCCNYVLSVATRLQLRCSSHHL